MTSLLRWSLVGALLFGLAGGGEEEASEPEDTVENAEAEAEEEEPAEEPVAEPTAEEVPIPEDFEEEAEESITAENYGDALDAIEAELEDAAEE